MLVAKKFYCIFCILYYFFYSKFITILRIQYFIVKKISFCMSSWSSIFYFSLFWGTLKLFIMFISNFISSLQYTVHTLCLSLSISVFMVIPTHTQIYRSEKNSWKIFWRHILNIEKCFSFLGMNWKIRLIATAFFYFYKK